MALKTMLMRGASMVLMLGGVAVYAAQSGLLPGIGNAASQQETPIAAGSLLPPAPPSTAPDEIVMANASGPAMSVAPVALALPQPEDGAAGIALPAQAPAPLLFAVPDAPGSTGSAPTPARLEIAETDAPAADLPGTVAQGVSEFGLPCGLSLAATAMPGATVGLDIMAPCQPGARVVIEHSGLTLTATTDPLGLLTLDIPGFESPAVFTVRMPDGQAETTLVTLPDLVSYDRVAVAWAGNRELELHAMEGDAGFGEPGHVWSETPGALDVLVEGAGGHLVELGDPTAERPMMAHVYSFSRDALGLDGRVALSIDAPVTEANCGLPVDARTLEITRDGSVNVTALTFSMPGCDAVGEYLVLQNLLSDLRLASN